MFRSAIQRLDLIKNISMYFIAQCKLQSAISSPTPLHGIDNQLRIYIRRNNLTIHRFKFTSKKGLCCCIHLSFEWAIYTSHMFYYYVYAIHARDKFTTYMAVIFCSNRESVS